MGKKIEKLSKPPILEALIDFRIEARECNEISTFKIDDESFLKIFPKSEEIYYVSANILIDIEPQSKFERKSAGLKYSNEAANIVAQLRNDGCTLNVLNPYNSWAEFKSLAKLVWDTYSKHVFKLSPVDIVRIGVRYINIIEPRGSDFKKLGDCYEFGMASCNEGNILGEVLRSHVKIESKVSDKYSCILQLNSKENGESILDYFLDIDIAISGNNIVSEEIEIDSTLDDMREIKNQLFFKTLTDSLIKQYE